MGLPLLKQLKAGLSQLLHLECIYYWISSQSQLFRYECSTNIYLYSGNTSMSCYSYTCIYLAFLIFSILFSSTVVCSLGFLLARDSITFNGISQIRSRACDNSQTSRNVLIPRVSQKSWIQP